MNEVNYRIDLGDDEDFEFRINGDYSFNVFNHPRDLVGKMNEYIMSCVPTQNIHKCESANTSSCSNIQSISSINSDDSCSGEGYSSFGLFQMDVYGYIIANIYSQQQMNNVYFKFINWDDNSKFISSLHGKNDFLTRLELSNKYNGLAVIPFGPNDAEHWATMLIDLKTKNLYVFDSSTQNFESDEVKKKVFGILSDDVRLINDEIQSEKAGVCGFWTLCACVEFGSHNNIHDIIDNNQEIKSEILDKIIRMGRDIVDVAREKVRYKNANSPYSGGHSYFRKGRQIE